MHANFWFLLLGGHGPIRITGTTAVTGNFYKLVAEVDTVIEAIVGLDGSWANVQLGKGNEIVAGNKTITSVKLTSGIVHAYVK